MPRRGQTAPGPRQMRTPIRERVVRAIEDGRVTADAAALATHICVRRSLRVLIAGGVEAEHARGTATPGWTSGTGLTRSSRRWRLSQSKTPRPVSRLIPPTGSSLRSRWTGWSQMNRSTRWIRSTRCSGWSLRTRVGAMSRRRSASQHSGRRNGAAHLGPSAATSPHAPGDRAQSGMTGRAVPSAGLLCVFRDVGRERLSAGWRH
jgi:hypothetical protein